MIHNEVQQLESPHQSAIIRLIGVGGGGCNAVEQMIAADIHGVDFTCVNTDAQALAKYHPDHVIQLGDDLTRGLGAGTDPEIGRLAAESDRDLLANAISGTDMLFLTAGMGGGTGTGAIPVIARIARELGVLTVAVVTKPFKFEGGKRHRVAEAGIADLRNHVDSLIVVPNENLLTHLGPNISLIDAFSASNDVLTNAVQSIAELITNPGLINVDFADVKSVMTEMGEAMMSTGRGIGEFRARDAAIAATESPLLDEIDLKEARGILANITASSDLSMGEFQIVGDILDQITADDANVVMGTVFDQEMKDEIRVTVVATGLNTSTHQGRAPQKQQTGKRQSKTSRLLSFGSAKKAKQTNNRNAKPAIIDKPAAISPQLINEAQPVSPIRPQTDDFQPIDPIFDDHAAAAPESLETNENCIACGLADDIHTANCPRAPKTAAVSGVKQDAGSAGQQRYMHDLDSYLNNDPPQHTPVVPSQRAPVVQPTVKRREFSTGQQKNGISKSLIGLATGTAVLLTIFYFVMTNKLTTTNNDVVDNTTTTSTLAERKLKSANDRLSGIDE